MGLVVLFVLIKQAIAPWAARRWLLSSLHKACKSCELSLSSVNVHFFPLALSSKNVRFQQGDPRFTAFRVDVESIFLPFDHHRYMGQVRVEKPRVEITDGDFHYPLEKTNESVPPPDFRVAGVKISDGSFTYIHQHLARKAVISVSHIYAEVSAFGGSPDLVDKEVESTASGVLENSGKFHLYLGSPIFAKKQKIDVCLEMAKQNIAALNRFFVPNDGIEVGGELVEGKSQVSVRGTNLKATVYASYQNLNLMLKKNEERSLASAMLLNFVESLVIRRKNIKSPNYVRQSEVALAQQPQESIVSFILRGMKEAAIKVSVK